ncbi:universal stress protein [Aquisalimonas asiatica]|uniref:Nucleotide-binding universal stress protein, UspA family n=1 Tax=Aquisalimonas asiatica TaxID=406100 RepID=A0A1H8PTH1_9GAMM|nr:universal stress protein [Aquisalimonas asiatica]SEO45322.1 Nucleotide-binding universal stress protein, UspA family [Aquisalimonas asiatica]
MINRILVAIDGSEHADKAVAMAAALAHRFDADLAIVHALLRGHIPPAIAELSSEPIPSVPPMTMGGASVDYQVPVAALEEIAGKLLEQAKATATAAGVKNVETSYHEGDPARVLLEAAKAHNADMIVMGSRGLGNLSGLLLGSVSHKVQQLFDGSVLTVK